MYIITYISPDFKGGIEKKYAFFEDFPVFSDVRDAAFCHFYNVCKR